MTYWLPSALGLALLFMGWRLLWLFVGVAGFAAGLQAAPMLFGMQPFSILWGVGLVCGVIGAMLALFFQKLAVVLGGVLAGIALALHLLPVTNPNAVMLISLVCGVGGGVVLFLFFDWVLIFFSAMIGASLIIDSLGIHLPWPVISYVLIVATGVAVQVRWMQTRRKAMH